MRALNLDQLRAFVEVVELGSFSAAAQRLRLTQPAVSQQVRQLERRLGLRLIERVGRRATPTSAGAELVEHARRIEGAVDQALGAMASRATGVAGRVRVGAGDTACIHLLPPALRTLREKHPALEIVVSTGATPDILRALDENAIDVALATLPAPGRAFLATPALEDEFVAIFARGDGQGFREASPAALASLPVVLFAPGANTRRLVDEWFLRAGVRLKPAMELGSVEAIKKLVAAGLGCSVLPGLAVTAAETQGELEVRRLKPRLRRTLAVVRRRDKPLGPGLREVVDALLKLRSARAAASASAPAGSAAAPPRR